MKILSIFTSLFLLQSLALRATDKVTTILVTTPVYHTLAESGVQYATQAHIGWDLNNLYNSTFLYSSPQIVGKAEKYLQQDINLISVYKIVVESDYYKGVTTVNINTAKAVKPATHPFTVEEVAKMAVKALRLDYPDKDKYLILVSKKPIKRQNEK